MISSQTRGARSLPRRILVGLAILAPQTVAVVAAARLWGAYHNTLAANGHWVSTKELLHRRVMGTQVFMSSNRTLAGDELDMGRWFGFQELLYEEPLALREVSFDFRLVPDAYLVFVCDVGEQGWRGVRVSCNERFPSALLTVKPDGEIVSSEPLAVPVAPMGHHAHMAVAFEPAALSVRFEDEQLGRFELERPERTVFGFRNGEKPAFVDDVRIRTDDGALIHESFENSRGRGRAAGLGLLAVAAVNGAFFALVRLRRMTGSRAAALGLGLVGALLVAAVGGGWAWRRVAKTYRKADAGAELAWQDKHAAAVRASIRAKYAPQPAPGVERVLVIGSSQTWGAGARHPGETYVEVLAEQLERAAPGRFECINAGISGLDAPRLLAIYREDWLALGPKVVIIDLGNNDKDAQAFGEALAGFAAVNAEHGIRTVFALEPNSIEHTPENLPLHATMRAVAELRRIPVVDLHTELKLAPGRGFLWWDFVHPTSFGHGLIAEALVPYVLGAD